MRAYLDGVAKKYGVRRYVKLRHVFKGAKWLADQGRWEVKILRLQDNHVSCLMCKELSIQETS